MWTSLMFEYTTRWLDITPTGRVIARCTQDIQARKYASFWILPSLNIFALVDGPIPDNFGRVTELSISLLIKLGAVIVYTPIFVIPGLVVFGIGGLCGQLYMKAQLAVKREMRWMLPFVVLSA